MPGDPSHHPVPTTSEPTLRTFLGIALPPHLALSLAEAVPPASPWRPTRPENLHLTLRFLGAVTSPTLADLTAHLAALEHPPLSVQLAHAGIFPQAGVLMLNVLPSPALLQLQHLTEAAAQHMGIPPEPRPYHPHITLARAPRRRSTPPLAPNLLPHIDALVAALPETAYTASAITLYQSLAGRYLPLQHFPLR